MTKAEKQEKKLAKKEKLKNKLLNPVDVKYAGPLSYRYLRIIAWVAYAGGQVVMLNTFISQTFGENILGSAGTTMLSLFSSLAVPLFSTAAFGIILNSENSFKKMLSFYGVVFLAIGLGVNFLYYRYVRGLFIQAGVSVENTDVFKNLIAGHVKINAFADLFSFALFHFFINYTPKTKFQGKKIAFFRLLCLIPVIYVAATYVLKMLVATQNINLPFFFTPFMPTKSPLVFAVFAAVSFWIKRRKNLFLSLGATEEQYAKYSSSKRSSLAFSAKLSVIILIAALIEVVIFIVILVFGIMTSVSNLDAFLEWLTTFGFGDGVSLLLAIPLIFLYSYNKTEKNTNIDMFIPFAGIGLVAFVYLEAIYNLLLYVLAK